MQVAQELSEKIGRREACVGILGLGYVGLPLAVEFASAGLPVIGMDLDSRKVEAVNAGRSYIKDVDQERMSGLVRSGNSGGPLLNSRGQVIGVNAQIETGDNTASGNVGIGFSIPSNTVKDVVAQILRTGRVNHAYLGISGQSLTEDVADQYNLAVEEGVLVEEVTEASGAGKAWYTVNGHGPMLWLGTTRAPATHAMGSLVSWSEGSSGFPISTDASAPLPREKVSSRLSIRSTATVSPTTSGAANVVSVARRQTSAPSSRSRTSIELCEAIATTSPATAAGRSTVSEACARQRRWPVAAS